MALSDLKQIKNKWALHAWGSHALFAKLWDIDCSGERILLKEFYQTNPWGKIESISIGSNFDERAIVCRKNIIDWLKIFYPELRRVV